MKKKEWKEAWEIQHEGYLIMKNRTSELAAEAIDLEQMLSTEVSANAQLRQENTKLKDDLTQLQADLDQLQAACCEEVTALKAEAATAHWAVGKLLHHIEERERYIEEQRAHIDRLMYQGEWVPVASKDILPCASGDGSTLLVYRDGKCIDVRHYEHELGFNLGDLRICRWVGGKEVGGW